MLLGRRRRRQPPRAQADERGRLTIRLRARPFTGRTAVSGLARLLLAVSPPFARSLWVGALQMKIYRPHGVPANGRCPVLADGWTAPCPGAGWCVGGITASLGRWARVTPSSAGQASVPRANLCVTVDAVASRIGRIGHSRRPGGGAAVRFPSSCPLRSHLTRFEVWPEPAPPYPAAAAAGRMHGDDSRSPGQGGPPGRARTGL